MTSNDSAKEFLDRIAELISELNEVQVQCTSNVEATKAASEKVKQLYNLD